MGCPRCFRQRGLFVLFQFSGITAQTAQIRHMGITHNLQHFCCPAAPGARVAVEEERCLGINQMIGSKPKGLNGKVDASGNVAAGKFFGGADID